MWSLLKKANALIYLLSKTNNPNPAWSLPRIYLVPFPINPRYLLRELAFFVFVQQAEAKDVASSSNQKSPAHKAWDNHQIKLQVTKKALPSTFLFAGLNVSILLACQYSFPYRRCVSASSKVDSPVTCSSLWSQHLKHFWWDKRNLMNRNGFERQPSTESAPDFLAYLVYEKCKVNHVFVVQRK